MVKKTLEEIKEILISEIPKLSKRYDIKLIYVFGSYAKGTNSDKSDIDIAFLLGDGYNPLDKLSLLGKLCDTLKSDDIDLVILNSANSVLKHQVIKYGKLIYKESEELKVYFEVRVLKEYMDMEHFRKTQMYYINEWVNNELEASR